MEEAGWKSRQTINLLMPVESNQGVFPPQLPQRRQKTLPWLSEQELTGLFPGRLEGYRRPDHTGSGTKVRLFSVFSYYFKERRPAFPLQAVKACKKGPIGLRWADLVWESPTLKRCCLHRFDTNIKKVQNNPEMLFCSLSIGCKKKKTTKTNQVFPAQVTCDYIHKQI